MTIDAIGLLCPLPILRLRKRIQDVASGTIVKVLADDPAALIDIPHFCAEAGHEYMGSEPYDAGSGPDKAPHTYLLRIT